MPSTVALDPAHITSEAPEPAVERYEQERLREPEPKPGEPDDAELFTILQGWGRVPPDKVDSFDHFVKVGGVVKDVPYAYIRRMKRRNPRIFRYIHVVPNETPEAEYPRITGLHPMDPPKLAAMLTASDPAAIFAALGPEKAREVIENLQRQLTEHPPAKKR